MTFKIMKVGQEKINNYNYKKKNPYRYEWLRLKQRKHDLNRIYDDILIRAQV